MNNSRTKRLPKIIIGQFIVGLIMIALAMSVLFYAQGYRFNVKNFKIIKTGVIFLVSDPKGSEVYLGEKLQDKHTPYAMNLTSGNYSVRVEKKGYFDWNRNFNIKSEMVTDFKYIELFYENIETKILTDKKKISLLNAPVDVLAVINEDDLLISNDYEIWQNNNLVTRFSEPILGVSWYSDDKHILFQQGNEIRIIENDGYNNTLLVTLSSKNKTKFITNKKGNELYYIDGGEYKVAKIK